MFENYFRAEMKRLNLKRYDVCKLLNCSMPTLKSRLQDPETLTVKEIKVLVKNDFDLTDVLKSLNI